MISLIHVPSELTVVASEHIDSGYVDEFGDSTLQSVYLRRSLEGMGELAHKWIITPRYKLRSDADPVRNNDYLILKNAQFKNLALTSFKVDADAEVDHLIGLKHVDDIAGKTGMKIVRLLSSRDDKRTEAVEDGVAPIDFVRGGDFVRLQQREQRAHLLCRVDDEEELQSTITPLGSVCRKRMDDKDRVHAVQVRSLAMQQPRSQYDFPVAYSPLGIWQIIPVDSADGNRMFHRIPYGNSIRLRHLASGQYLAIRPLHKSDSCKIKQHIYTHNQDDAHRRPRNSKMFPTDAVVPAPTEPVAAPDLEVRIDSDDEEEAAAVKDDSSDSSTTYTVTIMSASASKIKNSSWLGKNTSYLTFSYGEHFKAKTEKCQGKNTAHWLLDGNDNEFTIQAKYDELLTLSLKVELMSAQTILKDSIVGHGEVSLRDAIVAADHGVVNVHIDFKDKRDLFAGALELKVEVSNNSQTKSGSTKKATFTGIKVSTKAKEDPEEKDHEPDIVQKAVGSKWTVATCSDANKYTLFTIAALNKLEDDSGEGDFIAYDENIILESVATMLRLHLADVDAALEGQGWWEYTLDNSLIPIAHHPGMIVDSDVFLVQRVAQEEVQDTVFASRLVPLARAATASLQLTPSHDMLFEPLFRHFTAALYTFLLWTIGQSDCDGCLLPANLPMPQLLLDAAHRELPPDNSDESVVSDGDDSDSGSDSDVEDVHMEHPLEPVKEDHLSSRQKHHFHVHHHHHHAEVRHSSLAPWVGRAVSEEDKAAYHATTLEKHAVKCMAELYARNIPLNAKMIRRQTVLFELMTMEQLAQFLNVYFILQRAIYFTQDPELRSAYGSLPTFLEQACNAILKLLHACVYKNEKNALKMISIQGMFLSLVSQRISGWDAPIESIMEICRDYYSGSTVAHPGQLSVEEVLTRSIHSSDLRQILEQMSWMHMNNHESAENILKLLTLLCRSGKAADHFQNILANLLITCDPTSLELSSGDGAHTERRCSSMLFSTSFNSGRWHVQFKPQYTMPSQEERSLNEMSQELKREADNLKKLFNVYNSDESMDDILDLEECFCLLEDLGFGGPFVYEEMGHILGVNIWGFLNWWCTRAPFYFMSTAVSHSQISPYQAMQLMEYPIKPSDLMAELHRVPIKRQGIMQTLQFWGIISSRIPGYNLKAKEKEEISDDEDEFFPQPLEVIHNDGPLLDDRDLNVPGFVRRRSPLRLLLRQPSSQDWIAFDMALTPAWPDHMWLRNSLVLLESICSGGNILCQRIVSNLLPPECLLELLSIRTVTDHDRHIICELLVSVYVDVDFIFPTRALPAVSDSIFCGYSESMHNPPISIGKMFNPTSRVRFYGVGSVAGSDLRMKMFEYLRTHLGKIELTYSTSRGLMLYTNSLLRLFHALLAKGFFNEEEYGFFARVSMVARNCEPTAAFRKQLVPLEDAFTIDNIEQFLIHKLNDSLDVQRDEGSAADLTSATSIANMMSKKMSKTMNGRKTFQDFETITTKIDADFEDRNYSAIVNNTISILYLIHGMKQMMRIQKIWDNCMSNVVQYSLTAYSTNSENLSNIVSPGALTSPLQSLFREDLNDDDITKALFTGTLHVDRNLRQRCYDLLNRRLSLPMEISSLLTTANLVRHPHQSFLKRLLSVYISLAVKHTEDAMSSIRNYRDYTIHVLDFVLENIIGLMLNKFLDKINESANKDGSHRFGEDRDKVLNYYFTSADIPCPGGDDDFFLLDVKKVKDDEAEKTFLMERYSSENQQLSIRNYKWVLDVTAEVLEFVRKITPAMITRHASLGRPAWLSMGLGDQHAFNMLFFFLTTIGRENSAVRDATFPLMESLLIYFYPHSTGATDLMHLLLSCSQENKVDGNLINALRVLVDGHTEDTWKCKVELFTAMFLNSDIVYLAALRAMQDEMAESLREKMQELADNGEVDDALLLVKMLANSVSKKAIIPKQTLNVLKLICPAELLMNALTSDVISLEIKTEMVLIATSLYDTDELVVERLILAEIRSMRIAMALLGDAGKMSESRLIFHYITAGVIPAMKHRIMESNVISVFHINEYICGSANELQEKLINKQAGRHAEDLIARDFPIEFDLPSMKPSTSFLPSECITCLCILLNILSYDDAHLYRDLEDEQIVDLIWVCGALHLIFISRCNFVFDHLTDTSIDIVEYRAVIRALQDVLHGLILDRMSLSVEDYFMQHFQEQCLSIVTANISGKYDLNSQPLATGANEKTAFRQRMNIAVSFSNQHLKSTAAFRFLKQSLNKSGYFLRLGGLKILEDTNSPQLRSKAFASKFNGYSDFDIWLMAHGRFIFILLQHLGDVLHPTQTEYNLLHMLCLLMSTDIEEIRNSRLYSQNVKMLLIERETTALHRTQKSLLYLGSIRTVIRVLGRNYVNTDPDYTWKYAPLLLRLGGENMSWENKEAQETLVSTVLRSVDKLKPPECNCMLGLQDLIRKCSLGIISSVTGDGSKEDEQQLNILRASLQIFTFTGALCKGDNTRAQRFLSADGATSKSLVNISEALCMLIHAIIVRLSDMLIFISNDQFYEKLAPLIYAQKDSTKRRFLDWCNPRNNISLFAQFVYTISTAFEECISVCSQDSVNEILQAIPKTPALLEFLGLLQLKTDVDLSGNSVLAMKRSVYWKGGDPVTFYRTYLREMTAIGVLKATDPEYEEIKNVLQKWQDKVKGRQSRQREFAMIFGISSRLLRDIMRKAEYACLRLLLSCLEFADDQQSMDLLTRFNDAILVQNLSTVFHGLRSARGDEKDQLTSTTVAYVSLIESIGIYFKGTDELLTLWDKDMQSKGVRPKSIYGSVELVGADRRLRRVYFPVPMFVTTFWSYPEVQKLKEEIILEVNRNSPEEKIADFLTQITRISIVMKRQERLRLFLTYPLHAILGGKSIGFIQAYFPRQRAVGLYVAMLLNIWFVRANTAPFRPMATRPDYLEYMNWDTQDLVIYSVQFAHLLLMATFALRTLLNSDAADNLPELVDSESSAMQYIGRLIQSPVVLALLIWDSAWPCVLTSFSFFAITGYYWLYVPCLLDIVFQFDDMNFLYVAISRNVVRVGFTCLLAFLCLYFYAILAYLFFGTQYNLNGYEGCEDPGSCFKLHLDYGLSNSPGWDGTGYINPQIDITFPYSTQVAGVVGTLYNLTYVILINLVLQAVISGLIIDTFSSMRAEKEAVQQDIAGKCFTCSIGRDDFEQAGVSYNTHIKEEHNMWHYAWFKIYLDLKDPLSYSSTENYAIRCMKDKQVSCSSVPLIDTPDSFCRLL